MVDWRAALCIAQGPREEEEEWVWSKTDSETAKNSSGH